MFFKSRPAESGLRTIFLKVFPLARAFCPVGQVEDGKGYGICARKLLVELGKHALFYFQVFLARERDVPDCMLQVLCVEAEKAILAVLDVVAIIAVRAAPCLGNLEAALDLVGVKAVYAERGLPDAVEPEKVLGVPGPPAVCAPLAPDVYYAAVAVGAVDFYGAVDVVCIIPGFPLRGEVCDARKNPAGIGEGKRFNFAFVEDQAFGCLFGLPYGKQPVAREAQEIGIVGIGKRRASRAGFAFLEPAGVPFQPGGVLVDSRAGDAEYQPACLGNALSISFFPVFPGAGRRHFDNAFRMGA